MPRWPGGGPGPQRPPSIPTPVPPGVVLCVDTSYAHTRVLSPRRDAVSGSGVTSHGTLVNALA